MIDPTRITNFERTDSELETFMLFCIAVAGKSSDVAAPKVQELVAYLGGDSPFQALRERRHDIGKIMRHIGIGPYEERMIPATTAVLDLDLRTCTLSDLVRIKGIGHKTARMFLLHSRPSQEFVVLDVHILRWLREVCRMRRIPKATPSKLSETYTRIEAKACAKIKAMFPNTSFAEFDLNTWVLMSGRA